MIERGSPEPLGAHIVDGGVNFAVFSAAADAIELCLFHADDREQRLPLTQSGDIWHGFVPGCAAGQRFGYRAHGTHDHEKGLRFNPAKLLLDPYARELVGEFRWNPAVFDYRLDDDTVVVDTLDSAAFVPKCVVVDDLAATAQRPAVPWADTIVYETNVRGYTMRHPDVPDAERGRFSGMRNSELLDYWRALGITSVELMPVFDFIDEAFLTERDLRNLWGYNSVAFFAPARRYAQHDARAEFVAMVDAIHDAGFELILDVAYNHTGESGGDGPTLSFRGLDNLSYYRTVTGDRGDYVNDTGTGNTLDMDTPAVQRLVLDSLTYWHKVMGADGFRFDLATILGRRAAGFSSTHPFFEALADERELRDCKLIAEPWDPGPGGYQLGNFPANWAEWNDRYRDSARRFWRGDGGESAEFAKRLHGSADVFERSGRKPAASINFVTAHDGYTLRDLVSYTERHNQANGEDNRDGHAHNFSDNFGVEGDTDDPSVNAARRQQRLNFLATLLLSQGTPMLLGGDEFGNSQHGNNNVYAQDNDTGWVDWDGRKHDPEFLEAVRALVQLRRDEPLFRQAAYEHRDIDWLGADGKTLDDHQWQSVDAFAMVLTTREAAANTTAAAVIFNRGHAASRFALPPPDDCAWEIRFLSAAHAFQPLTEDRWNVPPHSLVCLTAANG